MPPHSAPLSSIKTGKLCQTITVKRIPKFVGKKMDGKVYFRMWEAQLSMKYEVKKIVNLWKAKWAMGNPMPLSLNKLRKGCLT